MKNNILKFILPVALFSLILTILIPYFTNSFENIRQKKENEEYSRIFLQEKLAREKAEQEAKEKVYLLGQFDPSMREDFALVPAKYDIGGYEMYLREETMYSFKNMAEVAEKDGIELNMTSATRNFDYQKDYWNKKWEGKIFVDGKDLSQSLLNEQERFNKLLEYVAPPGTSRHHWGTEIDINGVSQNFYETAQGEKVYAWLTKNAPLFGFCQTYSTKDLKRLVGYNEEKWHWSYLPLSKKLTQEYKDLVKDEDIKGFDGDQYFAGQNLINNYVLMINPECL